MHIAIVTAGGAGMFCGSCMHDNTWARALMAQGADVSLIPTYTPLRLDEQSASQQRVFFGGLNVYFNSRLSWWKSMPRWITGWFDHPALIRFATSFSVSTDAAQLGELTLSMLQGERGPHRAAVKELAGYLKQLRPDVIIFSNALLAGAVAEIRKTCGVPVICTVQGDDVFLDALTPAFKERAIQSVADCARQFDGFVMHSEYYRRYMAEYLSLPLEKCSVLPLGIDVDEHTARPRTPEAGRFVVGYFSRMAPEKGFHHLAEAFPLLKQRIPHATLKIGGYQSGAYGAYLKRILNRLKQQGIEIENIGSPDGIEEKVRFFADLDVFALPTDYREPKGLPALEAMANGVPVVLPEHGAFPEIIARTGGGLLVPPRNPMGLAEGLFQLADPDLRQSLAQAAWGGVRQQGNLPLMASRTLDLLRTL